MNFKFLTSQRKKAVKTLADYKMDVLIKQGKDQFNKLIEIGINIPVALPK